jgi:hypothetical protein
MWLGSYANAMPKRNSPSITGAGWHLRDHDLNQLVIRALHSLRKNQNCSPLTTGINLVPFDRITDMTQWNVETWMTGASTMKKGASMNPCSRLSAIPCLPESHGDFAAAGMDGWGDKTDETANMIDTYHAGTDRWAQKFSASALKVIWLPDLWLSFTISKSKNKRLGITCYVLWGVSPKPAVMEYHKAVHRILF